MGQSCSLRAQTPILTTRMLRAGALVFPPFLDVYSLGCASCAALCNSGRCGNVVCQDLASWNTRAAPGGGREAADLPCTPPVCRGWWGSAARGQQCQLCRAHLGPWVTQRDILASTSGDRCGTSGDNEDRQTVCTRIFKGQSLSFPALMALKMRIHPSARLLQQQLLSTCF